MQKCKPNDEGTYISFRASSINQCDQICKISKWHFHKSKKEDDQCETDKFAEFYDLSTLDVSRINKAFNRFKDDPLARGSLGWGILSKVYEFNSVGLSSYLLEQGGMSKLTIYKRENRLTKFAKTITALGSLFATFNFWSSFYISQIAEPSQSLSSTVVEDGKPTDINGFAFGHVATATLCYFANTKVQEIHSLTLDILNRLAKTPSTNSIQGLTTDIMVEAEHANTILKSLFRRRIGDNFLIIPSFTASVRDAGNRIAFWSKITLIPAVVSLGFLFIHHRFFRGNYDARDIAVAARKAKKAEERLMFQRYDYK